MTTHFELSSKWEKRVYPWRGDDRAQRRDTVQSLSMDQYLAQTGEQLRRTLSDPNSEPELISHVAQCDWANPDAISLGVLLALRVPWQERELNRPARLLKWLIETAGSQLALTAWIESTHLHAGPKSETRVIPTSDALHYRAVAYAPPISVEICYLRTKLSQVSEREYSAAASLLSSGAIHPVAAAFIIPTSEGLVDRALRHTPYVAPNCDMLLASVGTPDELRRLVDQTQGRHGVGYGRDPLNLYATLAARLGSPAVEMITQAMDSGVDAAKSAEFIELLSMCPAPEAVDALLSRLQIKGSRQALRVLLERAPDVGVTALSRSGTRAARVELEAFALSRPDVVAALVPVLDPRVADTLVGLTQRHDPLPESTAPPKIVWELADGTVPKIPKPAVWLVPELLPQIALTGRQSGLPRRLVARLITLCQLVDEVSHRHLEVAAQQFDVESLSAWARALFHQYREAGYPARDIWALRIQGWLGNDDTVRMISPLIQVWPRESAHKRALYGLSALSDIGTELALMHLYRISLKVPFKALRARAVETVAHIADELELTSEELGDRLVPDFGLSSHGTTTLDFGPRQFIVGFDQTLAPYLTDADGKPRKVLPKPAAADDSELAAAAAKQFSDLKKDVRGVAGDQVARLQRAMRYQRRFSTRDFESYFVAHPLVGILTRRLLWGSYGPDGTLLQGFRVAEDSTLADMMDSPLSLAPDALVGIAHPLQMNQESLIAWSAVFVDYELPQPFPQLGRSVYRLTDAERKDRGLRRFNGLTIPSRLVLGLSEQGWERQSPQDAGIQGVISQRLPAGAEMNIRIEPGIVVGDPDALGDQTITRVSLSRGRLGDIDTVLMSELLADLTGLEEHRR